MDENNQLSIESSSIDKDYWQDTMLTVKERISFLFNQEILSDVCFLVGKEAEKQRIPAHKLILSSGSAVFYAMFNRYPASPEISIPDVEPDAFLAVLLYLYTDKIEISSETVMGILYTAKKYVFPLLELHCVAFLKKNLTSDNACLLLKQAKLFDKPQLVDACLSRIDGFTVKALNANEFIDIDLNTLISILKRNTLCIEEFTLFEAVVRWSEAQCVKQQLQITPDNQRLVLGNALSFIRFRLMSRKEFVADAAQSGLLQYSNVLSEYSYFNLSPESTYKITPRYSKTWNKRAVCRLKHSGNSYYDYNLYASHEQIRFTVDRSVVLLGYGVYRSDYTLKDVLIELIDTDSKKVITSNMTNCSYESDSGKIKWFMFKEVAEILPNKSYTASVKFKEKSRTYCGSEGVSKISATDFESRNDPVTFEFSDVSAASNNTCVTKGQIPLFIFDT